MRQIFIIATFSLYSIYVQSQNIDSFFAQPQTLELSISTPQPRLNETFQISVDIDHIRANIFRSLIGKVQMSINEYGSNESNQFEIMCKALKKGKTEIGPLQFTINGTVYTTNKIEYEVAEPLPNVDKGLWFRKVDLGNSKFCIIIDQRIPASARKTILSDNSISFTTEPEYSEITKFKSSYSINGLSGINSQSYTSYGSIYDTNGEQKEFLYGVSVYYFNIEDKKIKIKITKDKLEHLPADFKFEDIIIQ